MAREQGRMLLAEYFLTDSQAVIMIAGPQDSEPELVTVPHTLAQVRALVAELTGTLESAPRRSEALERASELLADPLLADLVEPVANRLAPGDRVWLVPHDALHRVPLHAVGSGLAGHSVAYAPSASVLQHCRNNRGNARRRALVVADPPGGPALTVGPAQAELLTGLFKTDTLTGKEAVSGALVRRAASADILHVSAHGVFDATAPMRSGVMLADGLFTAERFLRLKLSGTLVVLAACRTGVAAVRPGDELLGLVRSVLHAGAPAVLVSLWTVDELATTILFGHFYERLASGEHAIDALRSAQDRLRMTSADDVLAYLASVAPLVSGAAAARLLVAEARIRLMAADFAGAAAACDTALKTITEPSARRNALTIRQRALLHRSQAPPNLGRPVYAHPYYWAAFVLIGDWH
ncbi:CHAT domain-containing protein [Streptomyces sp. NBC_00829]|uniref:CHAT domain-containing protein n=1 Tax=Streptomyces sp. NBC_00829 TaxID=2903679 RepID=UPI0038652D0A|nr:CHAT domain-containing protein [Streptomyces sp. NBC_00829]